MPLQLPLHLQRLINFNGAAHRSARNGKLIINAATLITTGKWEGGCCECGKKLPLGHLLIAGLVGLLLSVLVGALMSRRQ